VRAAVAEVEEYRRVTLRRVDDAMLSGAVVSGVAHMLAELVENGLNFSAPDVDVEIQGRLIGDRYLIAVVDQGVGMTADELAEANRRLRGEGDFLVAPARFLGHYVVGRLARDLGVGVELTPSPVTGTTARLLIPGELLATPPPIEAAEIEILEPASTVTADGRLRPVTVEYVTAAPFLPLQRAAADDRTPNGLPRRPQRVAKEPAATTHTPEHEAAADPDEVRARLTAFRSGMHRGDA
jgi:anti-sigma regulatory factor (Ser/Thr protein kinase)